MRFAGLVSLFLVFTASATITFPTSSTQSDLEDATKQIAEYLKTIDTSSIRTTPEVDETEKPHVPDQFYGKILVEAKGTRMGGHGEVWADTLNKRSLQVTENPVFNNETFSSAILHPNDSNKDSTFIINKMCRKSSIAKYFEYFSWIRSPAAVFKGEVEFKGIPCYHWQLSLGEKGNIEMHARKDTNTPYHVSFPLVYKGAATNYEITFLSISEGPEYVPPEKFAIPSYCNGMGPICEDGGVKTIEMYRVHAGDNYQVMNTNTADALGDSYYACSEYVSRGLQESKIASLFEVTLNATWGQYALCNDYSCDGLNVVNVGREQAFGIGDFGSQCKEDMKYGNWWSLPEKGYCGENHVGHDGCTWRTPRRLKSITYTCLKEKGYFDSCMKLYHGDQDTTVALLEIAFAECPDAPPPRPTVLLV